MALTGSTFLDLVLALTLGAFVAFVLVWPKLAGRGIGHIAGRVVALLLVNLMVLFAAATQLNATYLFFADWTDLRGALTNTLTQTQLNRGGSTAEATVRNVPGTAARAATRLPALDRHGTLSYVVHGRFSGLRGTVVVQLPPGYNQSSSRRYPVIEAFAGYPGSPYGWAHNMEIAGAIATQVDAHRLSQAIVVSPTWELPPGADTECVNGSAAGAPMIETWLTRDVPNWIAAKFRVRTDRESWATIGLSAGGWCAAMAAMLHPAQYGAAIVLGGYFRPEFSPFFEPYPPSSPLTRRYDLVRLAHDAPPPILMWLETSHADPVSYSSSAAFLTKAHKPLSLHAIVLQHAGHRAGLWKAMLPECLSWLGANVPGFKP